ncbi:MAG: hypothetical protein H0X51_07100 [Parachlamydiaceae bacterium]|nr:hypothetical protein [Parachlamydiaceae bacterium]
MNFCSDVVSRGLSLPIEERLDRFLTYLPPEGEYLEMLSPPAVKWETLTCTWFRSEETDYVPFFKYYVVGRLIHLVAIPIFMVTYTLDTVVGVGISLLDLATLRTFSVLSTTSNRYLHGNKILSVPYLHLLWAFNPSAQLNVEENALITYGNGEGFFSNRAWEEFKVAKQLCQSDQWFVRHVVSRSHIVLTATITLITSVADGILGITCAGLSLVACGKISTLNTTALVALRGFCNSFKLLSKMAILFVTPSNDVFDAESLTSITERQINRPLYGKDKPAVGDNLFTLTDRAIFDLRANATFIRPNYSSVQEYERISGWFTDENNDKSFFKHYVVARVIHLIVIPIFLLTIVWDVGVGAVSTVASLATLGLSVNFAKRSLTHLRASKSLLAIPYLHLLWALNPSAKFHSDGKFVCSISEGRGFLSSHAIDLQIKALRRTHSPDLLVRHLISRPLVALAGIIVVIAQVADGIIGVAAAGLSLLFLGKIPTINTLAFIALKQSCDLAIFSETVLTLLNPTIMLSVQNDVSTKKRLAEIAEAKAKLEQAKKALADGVQAEYARGQAVLASMRFNTRLL